MLEVCCVVTRSFMRGAACANVNVVLVCGGHVTSHDINIDVLLLPVSPTPLATHLSHPLGYPCAPPTRLPISPIHSATHDTIPIHHQEDKIRACVATSS